MKKLSLAFVLLSLAALLAACGGSGGAGAPAASLSVEMTEFTFTPKEMTVFSGRETTLELKNSGSVEHAFTILKKGVAAQTPFDREKQAGDILVEFKVGTGQSETVKFTLPEPGEYSLVCAIPGHMEAGMVGKLTAVQP
jgi:uncharacterized cupredoxin-like copper-binding protein